MKRISWILPLLMAAGIAGCGEESKILINASPSMEDDFENTNHNTKPDNTADDLEDKKDTQDGANDADDSKTDTESGTNTDTDTKPETGTEIETEPEKDPEPTVDACNNQCTSDQTCQPDGTCLQNCAAGQERCGTECLDFNTLHLSSCSSCDADYCDSDNNLGNGCDIYVKGDDPNNCGACGNVCTEDKFCSGGACISKCSAGANWCSGECLNFGELHLSSCNACEANYCDSDGNISNGCESYVFGDDPNNCGACGNKCDGACEAGQCVKSFRALAMGSINLTANADGSGGTVASASKYDYVQVLQETGGKSKVSFNGKVGWVNSSSLLNACDECEGRKAIDLAEKYLYTKHDHLCTYDFLTYEPHIDNFVDFSWLGGANNGYDLNCANFVTAMLISTGLYTNKTSEVSATRAYAETYDHYRYVSDFSQAKAGDIWTCGNDHAELVVGYYGGNLVLIGSNNFWYGDGYNNCKNTYSTDETAYQRVSYGTNAYCSKTQYVMTRQ